ncbi:protein SPT2 homolog [Cebus imitator]|uniref:protein SPT2 homolog n=1 Tax=Cebus imitator TaxID=2715852 RepID=UPI0018975DEA|nr:protein SPT2 homolog [Cebus imitator]
MGGSEKGAWAHDREAAAETSDPARDGGDYSAGAGAATRRPQSAPLRSGRPSPQRPRWPSAGSPPWERICSASAGLGCPRQLHCQALARPSSLPPPGSRWTGPLPRAAAASSTARAFERQGLRSRVLGTGRALAAAARGNLSLPCYQVPAEEGEGRGAAFPVPPARFDLRGLRLLGNSRAAAGPGSVRGLVGAGLERFGTTSPRRRYENLVLPDVKEKNI